MKILFQEPILEKGITFGKFEGVTNNTFPYGVASIAQYMRDRGHNIIYLEPNIENIDSERYKEYLLEKKFDLVGIGSTTLQVGKAFKTFELVKKINPGIITVLGGVHATIMPEETLKNNKDIDYLILGEGEKPFARLVKLLEKNKRREIKKFPKGNFSLSKSNAKRIRNLNFEIKKIKGVAFRDGKKVVINSPDFLDVLKPEEFPFPAYDLFPMDKYFAQITYSKTFPSYSILFSRGCAFKCSFCNASDVVGRRVRYKPVEDAIKEIKLLKEKYGAKGLIFQDSTFTVNNKWVEEFCKKMIEEKINLPWSCNARVDTVNPDLLKLMKKAGCWEILYGIESANQKSLDLINKKVTVEQNTKAIKMTIDAGIYTYASYIICLPGETEEDALNTIEYAKKMATPITMFYLPIPFPKTELWNACKKDGGLREDANWEEYNAWDAKNPVYVNPLIGKEKMQKLLNYAYSSYYKNPKVVWRNIKEILLFRQSPKKFWYALKSIKIASN